MDSGAMFVYGDDDNDAALEQTIDLALLLRRRGIRADAMILPGESHSLSRRESMLAAYRRVESFLWDTLGSTCAAAGAR